MSKATDYRKELLPDDDGSKIFVDFYESSVEGPTVRLDVQSIESLHFLSDFVRKFSNSPQTSAALSELTVFFPVNEMKDIILSKIDKQSRESSELRQGVLNLALTAEGWVEVCDKIEGLMQSDSPSHNYLESYKCRVTLELAYKE